MRDKINVFWKSIWGVPLHLSAPGFDYGCATWGLQSGLLWGSHPLSQESQVTHGAFSAENCAAASSLLWPRTACIVPKLLYLLGHILVESQTTGVGGGDIRAVISGQRWWQTHSSVLYTQTFPNSDSRLQFHNLPFRCLVSCDVCVHLQQRPKFYIDITFRIPYGSQWTGKSLKTPPCFDCNILAPTQKVLVPFCTFFGLFAPRLRDKPWCQGGTWKAALFLTLPPFCLVTDAQFGFPPPKLAPNWIH